MIKAIIIDDEPLARSLVKEYLEDFPEIQVVAECNDGFEGVKAVMQNNPELIILDVQMPKINGFEMLELIDPLPSVIFTTAFDEYAIKAFEANAADYLLKPFSKERFSKAIQKWMMGRGSRDESPAKKLLDGNVGQREEQNRIVVKNGSNIRIIPARDIFYLEALDDYVKIFTIDSHYLKKKTMSFYEKSLNPSEFVRVHRSYIINLQHLTRVEPFEKNSHIALLKNNSRIPLSRSGYVRLKEILGL